MASAFQITEIVPLDKKRSKVYLDHEFAFVLYKGELPLYGIRKGNEIGQKEYDRIIEEVLVKRAKLRAMNLLKDRPYTEKKLRDKLVAGQYPASCIEQAIEYVKSYGYINDRQYAQDYLFYHGKKLNKKQAYLKLKEKGIAEAVISEVYEAYCDSGEAPQDQELILAFLKKKKIMPEKMQSQEEKNRIIRSLLQRGFPYDRISETLQLYGKNAEEYGFL